MGVRTDLEADVVGHGQTWTEPDVGPRAPFDHGFPIRPSTAVIASAVAKGLSKTFGPSTDTPDAIEAALKAADERLAPFRKEALNNGE